MASGSEAVGSRRRRDVAGLLVVGALALVAAGAGAATSSWQIEDLTPGTSSFSEGNAVNAAGQVVGMTDGHAVLWDAGGVTDVSGGLDGLSWATGINDVGEVTLVQGGGPPCAAQGYSAFVWRSGVVTELPTLGGTDAVATAINDEGVVVGASCPSSASGALRHAVRWVNDLPVDLGGLDGSVASYAYAVNDDGTAVGYSGLPATNPRDEQQHAVLWDASGEILDLGTLPGAVAGNENSVAAAINDDGLVVGWSTTSDGATHAVLWEPGTHAIVDLGTLAGGSFSRAYGVSDDGVVVGWGFAADGGTYAFAWTEATGMVALSGLHATSTGTVAKAIGAAGLIVGSSDAHAVVWRPAADSDGDGVPDALDVAVTTPPGSVGFSDAVAPDSPALGVGTYGVITPNGLGVSVQDLNPNTASSAVRVSALAGAGSGPLDLMACGEEPAWALEADDVVSVACGSVSIDVQGGDGVTGRSGSSSIALAVGTRATFESLGESLVITGVEDGPVTVTVDLALDAVVTFPAGTAGTIDTTTAALTDVTGDGVTLTVGGMEVPISAGPGVTLIQGGVQNDTISGTPEDDVIVDAGGNNTINGRSGNDVIATAGGNDTIDGSAGNDRIDAGDGNNQVKGGDGDDRITTGRGNDTIDGGRHTDVCSPGIGKDSLKNCETRS